MSARCPRCTPWHTPSCARREERHRCEDSGDESQVVPLEVASEEEEGEERKRIAREERRDRGSLPQTDEPPGGDRCRDRDLDRGEREIRLTVWDQAESEEDGGEAHPRDRVRPCGATRVVADDVIPEGTEVVHKERRERRD